MKKERPWWETRQFQFAKVPMALFADDRYKHLSPAAKLLYALLLDRMGLSELNGWVDSEGEIFIFCTLKEVGRLLRCRHDKATSVMRELEQNSLLRRERQGLGKPDRIYVLPFSTECDISAPCDNSADQNSDSPHSGMPETSTLERDESASNQIERNYTNNNHTHLSIYPEDMDAMIDEVKEQIEFDILLEQEDAGLVNEIVLLMADTLRSTAPTLRVRGIDMPTAEVKQRLGSLNRFHVEYVLMAVRECTTEIRNIRAYLLTALYSAPVTMESYYEAKVRHDMPELFRHRA